jgi:hypothetical protein
VKHEWNDILLIINTWGSVWGYNLLLLIWSLDFDDGFWRRYIPTEKEGKPSFYGTSHKTTTLKDEYKIWWVVRTCK